MNQFLPWRHKSHFDYSKHLIGVFGPLAKRLQHNHCRIHLRWWRELSRRHCRPNVSLCSIFNHKRQNRLLLRYNPFRHFLLHQKHYSFWQIMNAEHLFNNRRSNMIRYVSSYHIRIRNFLKIISQNILIHYREICARK